MQKDDNNNDKVRVVIYGRYSSVQQREESIEAQERACIKHCEYHDYIIVKKYFDSAVSGKTTDKRDKFIDMIEDAKKGLFDKIIVHKLNRFREI